MRSYLILLVVGVASAAVHQQPTNRSPVYPSGGSATKQNNMPNMGKSLMESQSAPALNPGTAGAGAPLNMNAQAREGTVPEMQQGSQQASPAQNYLVYYYPEHYRTAGAGTGGGVGGSGAVVGAGGYSGGEPGMFGHIRTQDVAYVASALVLILGGAYTTYLYSGANVKARALRSLQEMTFEDASQIAHRVLRAVEKFQNINNETQ